jgi:hypothetical protein
MRDWEALTKNEKIEYLDSQYFDSTSDVFRHTRDHILRSAKDSLPYMDQDQIDYFSQNCFNFCKFTVDLQNQRNGWNPESSFFAELYYPSIGNVYEEELEETANYVDAESPLIKEVIFPGITYPNLDFSSSDSYYAWNYTNKVKIHSLSRYIKAIVMVE